MITAMLMGMGMVTDMGMGKADTMVQSQYKEDRMMEEPSW
jgi:hypothetical protein